MLLLLVLLLLVCDHHWRKQSADSAIYVQSENQFDYEKKQPKEDLYWMPHADFTKCCCKVQKFAAPRSRAEERGTFFVFPLLHFYSGGVPNLTSLSREIFPMFGKWGEEEGRWKDGREVEGGVWRQTGWGRKTSGATQNSRHYSPRRSKMLTPARWGARGYEIKRPSYILPGAKVTADSVFQMANCKICILMTETENHKFPICVIIIQSVYNVCRCCRISQTCWNF
jgi:hypothetical protein